MRLAGRAVERSGLGREPDKDRRGDERPPAAASLSARCAIRPTSARRSGVGSSRASEASPRASFDGGRAARPEVGDGRGHDQPLGRRPRRRGRAARIWPRSRRGRPRRRAGSGTDAARDQGHAGAAGERRLGDRDAHLPGGAVADEPNRIDRLGRAAGRDDDVAAREIGRAAARRRWPGGRVGRADGRSAIAATTASTIGGELGEPAHADWPDASGPDSGLHDRGSRNRRAAARRSRGSPGARTSRRPSPARRRPAPRSRGTVAVTASPASPLAIAASQWAVAGATTNASAESAITMWPIRPSGSSASTSVRRGGGSAPRTRAAPTNRVAGGVSRHRTSAPSAWRSRSSSGALYAAIEPVTPSAIRRPSSGRPVTARARGARLAAGRPRRGRSRGP